MAVEAGVAYISIAASTKDFAKDVRSALGDFEKEARQLTDGKKGFGARLAGGLKFATKTSAALVATVGALAIKGGISRALAIEDAQAKLQGLGHDTKAIDTIMGNALASVKGTAFGLGDAAGQAATLVAAGIKPGRALESTLKLVADSATIAGTDLNDMGLIWGKVAAKGRVDGQIVNQMLERQIPILDMLGDHYGVTAAEASEMVTKGKVSFSDFSQAMESMVGGAALKSGATTRGSWNNMLAALSRGGEKLISGVFPYVREFFGGVMNWADSVAPSLETFGAWLGEKIPVAANWMKANVLPVLQSIGDWLTGTGVPAVRSFASWFKDVLLAYVTDFVDFVKANVLPVLQNFVGEMRNGEGAGGGFANAIKNTVTWLRDAGKWLAENRTLVWSLVGALAAWKAAQATLGLARWIIDLGGATKAKLLHAKATAVNTIASIKNAAAWAASRAETVAIMAMYAGEFIKRIALATVAWVANTASLIANSIAMRAYYVIIKAQALGALIASVGRATVAWVANTAALVAQRVAMVAVRGAMVIATVAQWAWNAALTANPIGLVVAAIAGLVAGLVWFFTQTELGQKIWSGFTNFLSTSWEWIKKAFAVGVKAVTGFLQGAWDFIKKVWSYTPIGIIVANWGRITSAFSTGAGKVRGFLQGAWDFIKKVWAYTPIGLITSNWGKIMSFFSGIPGKIRGYFNDAKDWLKNAGQRVIDGLLGGLRAGFDKVAGVARELGDKVKGAFSGVLQIFSPSRVFRGYGANIIQGLVGGLDGNSKQASSAITRIANKVKDTKGLGDAKKSGIVAYVTAQGRALTDLLKQEERTADRLKAARSKLATMRDERSRMAEQTGSSLQGEFRLSDSITGDGASRAVSFKSIASNVSGMVSRLKSFATSLGQLAKAGFPSGLIQEVAGLGSTDGLLVAAALLKSSRTERRSLSKNYGALSKWSASSGRIVADDFYKIGIQAQQGLVKGLESQQKNLEKAAGKVAKTLTKRVRKDLGIKSPSRVMAVVGRFANAGLAMGLRDLSLVDRAMSSLSDAVASGFSSSLTADAVNAAVPGELSGVPTMLPALVAAMADSGGAAPADDPAELIARLSDDQIQELIDGLIDASRRIARGEISTQGRRIGAGVAS